MKANDQNFSMGFLGLVHPTKCKGTKRNFVYPVITLTYPFHAMAFSADHFDITNRDL